MGDKATLAKARMELEELYLGIPDESVNLTFGDLAEVKQLASEKKKTINLEPISEAKSPKERPSPLNKLPSLDFNRGLQAANNHHHHIYNGKGETIDSHMGHHHQHQQHHYVKEESHLNHAVDNSLAYDVSSMSTASMYQERGGRRRPGIPHSNICTICSTYIYIFRHRCLVCGRVYCRSCLSVGMGEMSEGRKCIGCLGRRFSQRYIQRAGKVGCCSSYPSLVKQAELKWAEKGPRRSGERGYGHSVMMARPRSPITPRTPTRSQTNSNQPSFVVTSPYSPYTPNHHHMPF